MSEPNVTVVTRKRTNVKNMTSMAMLTALAYVVMLLSKTLHSLHAPIPLRPSSSAVLIFFHPDCNCWSRSFTGSADALLRPVADFTASGELHPALKTKIQLFPASSIR